MENRRTELAYTNKHIHKLNERKYVKWGQSCALWSLWRPLLIRMASFLHWPLCDSPVLGQDLSWPGSSSASSTSSSSTWVTETLVPEESESSVTLPVFGHCSFWLTFTTRHGSTKGYPPKSLGLQKLSPFPALCSCNPITPQNQDQSLQPVK